MGINIRQDAEIHNGQAVRDFFAGLEVEFDDDQKGQRSLSHRAAAALAERERLRAEFNRRTCASLPIPRWLWVALHWAGTAVEKEVA